MEKTLKVYFYKVDRDESGIPDIGRLLENSARESRLENLNAQILKYIYRMERIEKTGEIWTGDLIKARMSDIPPVFSMDKKSSPLPIDADQGIAEETAFFYWPEGGIAGLQQNIYGTWINTFSLYLSRLQGREASAVFTPVLQPQAYERMLRMETHRVLNVKVSGIDDPNYFSSISGGKAFAEVTRYFHAPTVELTISMGRKRSGGLSGVRDVVKDFYTSFGVGKGKLEKLKVTGTDACGKSEAVNLLLDRLFYEAGVMYDPEKRTTSYDERKRVLMQSWDANRDFLNTFKD